MSGPTRGGGTLAGARLLVVGGRQRRSLRDIPEWHAFDRAVLASVTPGAPAAVSTALTHQTPPALCAAEHPSITFKAASLHGDELLLCTQTEVMGYRLPGFRRTFHLSHPSFNDLHHVRRAPDGTLVVVNTGLDLVMRFDDGGRVVQEWGVYGPPTWERFDRGTDYRTVATTKPHLSHPNYAFYCGEDLWVTRFEQRDAWCLTGTHPGIPLGDAAPHDGVLHDGSLWFTTVTGWLIEVDPRSRKVVDRFDLNSMTPGAASLGWCRGVCLTGGAAWVGFTRVRPTALRANLSWVRHGFQRVGTYGTRPTRIARYDLARRSLVEEIDLEPGGVNAIFSILDVSDAVGAERA